MENLISIEDIIKKAKKNGIDFGKGDPYNRLRYYTKIGWLPHMERKDGKGHYPEWALQRLLAIEKLKAINASNEEIEKELNKQNWKRSFTTMASSPEIRSRIVLYASFFMLALILSSEMGFVKISKSKQDITSIAATSATPKQIIESGTSFVPKGEKVVFVKVNNVDPNYKIYVTFNNDINPASRFWVEAENSLEGFFLYLDKPVLDTSEFSWWVSE
ncbi:MAG: MerR family transcriptional regulator [Patescibacteria group bacterium]|jgi:DNA-binding transcriptional MerR regulator